MAAREHGEREGESILSKNRHPTTNTQSCHVQSGRGGIGGGTWRGGMGGQWEGVN